MTIYIILIPTQFFLLYILYMKKPHRKSQIIHNKFETQQVRRKTIISTLYMQNINQDIMLKQSLKSQLKKFIDHSNDIKQIIQMILDQVCEIQNNRSYINTKEKCLQDSIIFVENIFDQFEIKYMLNQDDILLQQQPEPCQIDGKTTFQINIVKAQSSRLKKISKLNTCNSKRNTISDQFHFIKNKIEHTENKLVPLNTIEDQQLPQIEKLRSKLWKEQKTKFVQKKEYLDKMVIQNLKKKDAKEQQFTYGFQGEKILLKPKNLKKIDLNLNMTAKQIEKSEIMNVYKAQVVKKQINNSLKHRDTEKWESFFLSNQKRNFKQELEEKLSQNRSMQVKFKQNNKYLRNEGNRKISKKLATLNTFQQLIKL